MLASHAPWGTPCVCRTRRRRPTVGGGHSRTPRRAQPVAVSGSGGDLARDPAHRGLDDAAAARVAAAAAPPRSREGEATHRRGEEVRSFRRTYVFPLPHPTTAAASPSAGSLPAVLGRAAQQLSSGDRVYLGAGVLLATLATTVLVALRRAVADEAQRGVLPLDSSLAARRAALRRAPASPPGSASTLSRDERLKRMGLHLTDDMRSAAAARSGAPPGAPAQAAGVAASLTPAERALAAAQVSAAKRRADADAALARAEAAAAAELAAAEAAAEAAAKQAELEAASQLVAAAVSVQPAAESQSAAGDDEAVQAAIARARARAQSRVSSRGLETHSRAPRAPDGSSPA